MKYNCQCIIHVYDGISTKVRKETKEVEANNEDEAKSNAINGIKNHYRTLSHLGLSGVTITSVNVTE